MDTAQTIVALYEARKVVEQRTEADGCAAAWLRPLN